VLNLPDPDGARLPNSPLDLVVTQIRFDARDVVSETKFGFAFRDALAGEEGTFPRLEPVEGQSFNIAVGAGGAQQISQGPAPKGWKFLSEDGASSVVLMPDSIAVETRRYETWATFLPIVERTLRVLADHVGPEIELRLGLRYIDRIREASVTVPSEWAEYLAEPLRGFLAHPSIGNAVKAHQHQVVFDLGDGECRFVHGTLPADEGETHYVLDYDLYREDPQPFSVDALLAGLESFHTDALKIFQASTEPKLIEVFQ
jgi:uncharacterized protein (TIGR04255 family)